MASARLRLNGEQGGQQICNAAYKPERKHQVRPTRRLAGFELTESMKEFSAGRPTKKIDPPNLCRDANAIQCIADAVEVVFLGIQARAFAKSSPDTRTYPLSIPLTVPT